MSRLKLDIGPAANVLLHATREAFLSVHNWQELSVVYIAYHIPRPPQRPRDKRGQGCPGSRPGQQQQQGGSRPSSRRRQQEGRPRPLTQHHAHRGYFPG